MQGGINNFQHEFTLEGIEIAKDVTNTYYSGMSRMAQRAPMPCKSIHDSLIRGTKDKSEVASGHFITQVAVLAYLHINNIV